MARKVVQQTAATLDRTCVEMRVEARARVLVRVGVWARAGGCEVVRACQQHLLLWLPQHPTDWPQDRTCVEVRDERRDGMRVEMRVVVLVRASVHARAGGCEVARVSWQGSLGWPAVVYSFCACNEVGDEGRN